MRKLAIHGGTPIRTTPLAPWPIFAQDEIDAVTSILQSGKVNYWTGEEGHQFEKEFSKFIGCDHGIVLANGTVALELALYALGIGPGDEVIVTSRTFIASASCIVMRGAIPVMADVDPESQNITVETIRTVLSPRTKAIILVHLAGWPCDMDSIIEFSRKNNLKVIEDCAQAHGATYKGRPVGSFGDVATFSFCQDKIMTTGGEGGMLLTNERMLWERAWAFKDHGKSYEAVYYRQHPPGYQWLHESFGTNWRLTEMQSGIGRIQLRKLPSWIETRSRHANILTRSFAQIPGLRVTIPTDHIGHSYYKYYVFVYPNMFKEGWNRNTVIAAINAEGIPCLNGSCSEIYMEKAFDLKGFRPINRLKVARELGETSLMFLVHPTLTEEDMEDTCRAVEDVMQNAVR